MKSYSILRARVVYEVLSTEVIVVDFSTGNYYALTHIAKQVWQCIEARASIEKIAQILSSMYGKEKDVILQDLHLFFADLLENGLIEPTDIEETEPTLIANPDWEYDAPVLQKYTDVQSLLLLDPIHDVAEVGWPAKNGE